MISTILTKTGGRRTLEHKLQAVVPILCWYFSELHEKTIVKKENISSFLQARSQEFLRAGEVSAN